MKVSLFYLCLPDNLHTVFSDEMIDNFLEVKSVLTILPTKRYDENKHMWIYLYAFTNNKEYADIFESLHDEKLFTRIDKEVNKDEFKKIRCDNIESEIIKYKYGENEEDFILCTKSEKYDISETFKMWADREMMDTSSIPYSQFKEKFIEALDKLLYCTSYTLNFEDVDVASYNMSYGCSVEGYLRGKPGLYTTNTISIYVRLFSLLLKKEGDRIA